MNKDDGFLKGRFVVGMMWGVAILLIAITMLTMKVYRAPYSPVEQQLEANPNIDSKIGPYTNNVKDIKECNCPAVDAPVCGKNYQTYPNACEAACDDTKVRYLGYCKSFKNSDPLPPNCKLCNKQCPENKEMYIDEQGCPNCECNLVD